MNDAFAAWVYPTIRYVLDALDGDRGRGRSETSAVDLPQVTGLLEKGAKACEDPVDYELARCALEHWIDETLAVAAKTDPGMPPVQAFRPGGDGWEFFRESRRARERGQADVLEIFYLCTALGYQGGYRAQPSPTGVAAEWPPTLSDWAKQVFQEMDRRTPSRFDPTGLALDYDPETDALPLKGHRFRRRSWAVFGVVAFLMAVLGGAWYWFSLLRP